MKAVQIQKFGGIEVLEVKEIAEPQLKSGQILVENHAASINPFDWKFRAGFMPGLARSFPLILGGDFAGKVIALGEDVSEFKIGDEIYGQAQSFSGASGSMAEVITANVKNVARKPRSANFQKASALPLAGCSAIEALEELLKLRKDQKILIHGGAGGIGHLAIQLAKALGAHVATTVSAEDIEFVKKLGADEVVNYRTERFEEKIKDFDAVFDTVGGETTDRSFQVLKKGGILLSMLGEPNQESAKKYSVTAMGQGTQTDFSHLKHLAELVDVGKIKVHIDKIFPLAEVREAFKYQEETHPQGKVVLKIREV